MGTAPQVRFVGLPAGSGGGGCGFVGVGGAPGVVVLHEVVGPGTRETVVRLRGGRPVCYEVGAFGGGGREENGK